MSESHEEFDSQDTTTESSPVQQSEAEVNPEAKSVDPEKMKSPIEDRAKTEMLQAPVFNLVEESLKDAEAVRMERLNFLNGNMAEMDHWSEHYPAADNVATAQGQAWVAAIQAGMEHLYKGDSFTRSVTRENSHWRQKVQHEGEEIAAGRPKFGNSSDNTIAGEAALMKVSSGLGLGSVVQIPLWHTGIWLSIKPPSEGRLLELDRRIANEKITLGRYSSGMVFSNVSVYLNSHVINLALECVYDATIKNMRSDHLKDLIKITDIQTLVWGMACAIYPKGYKYSRACTANPANCQHVVQADISLPKMFWTDNDSLSDWQRRHMTKRSEKFSAEELRKYADDHSRGGPRKIQLNDEVGIRLKVPTIAEYEQSGMEWVDGIVELLENSLGTQLRGEDRDEYITDQGRLTALRQYAHWVESIDVGEEQIVDRASINEVLNTISSDEKLADVFFDEVGKYIDDSTISLIGIPKYDCPRCGQVQHGDMYDARHPHILPIDVISSFFTLLDQRLYKGLTAQTSQF